MSNTRALIALLATFTVFVAVMIKLTVVQLIEGDEYRFQAERQQMKTEIVPAERGKIYDRNKTLLAYNSADVSFFVDRRLSREYGNDSLIAAEFARILDRPVEEFEEKLENNRGVTCVARRVDPLRALPLKRLDIVGLFHREESTRVYHYGALAAHALGYVDMENRGVAGGEKSYDKILAGEDGKRVILRDAVGSMITVLDEATKPATPGGDLVLAVDKYIQESLEAELDSGLVRSGGEYAVGVVMNPNTGEALALAVSEDFDPNQYYKFGNAVRRNKAVTDMYEPGSTFKTFAMATLLDLGLCHDDELVFTEEGDYHYYDVRVQDSYRYEWLTVKEIFAHSSNIGMSKLSHRADEETFFKYIRSFGFGNMTNVKLPGETEGLLPKPAEWSRYTKMSMSYGYHVAVTPVQLAAAFCAVVNGGVLYQPQLVRETLDKNGGVVERFEPKPIRRVISEATSKKMRSYLEQAVEDGTGAKARVDGVRVGGKTGTARQVVNGEYSQTKYNASFIGAFPIDDPQYVILIMIHTPTVGKYYGGDVGAPIFRGVVERMALRNPSLREGEEIEKTFASAVPYVGSSRSPSCKLDSLIAAKTADKSRMPDLRGASLREAVAVMSALNLRYELVGSGKVKSQTIRPGSRIAPGMTCVLKGENVAMAEATL